MTIISFLTGLSLEFEAIKSEILSELEMPFLQDIFSRLLCIENLQSYYLTSNNSALVSHGSQNNQGNNKARGIAKITDNRSQKLGGIVFYYCH